MEEEHNCGKAGGTATGHLFILDNEWMFRCVCGKYYEVPTEEVHNYFTEAEERNGE